MFLPDEFDLRKEIERIFLHMDSENLESLQSTFRDEDKELYMSIRRAFEKLYQNDIYLIEHEPPAKLKSNNKLLGKHYVGERAIVFRFAHYLQIELCKSKKYHWYNLDCEYNRNKTDPKILPSFPNGAFPDLIIHERSKNDHNLLVMEFKTYWNNSQESINKDLKKINEFMKYPYNYKYGLVVVIEKNLSELKFIFENDTNNTEK